MQVACSWLHLNPEPAFVSNGRIILLPSLATERRSAVQQIGMCLDSLWSTAEQVAGLQQSLAGAGTGFNASLMPYVLLRRKRKIAAVLFLLLVVLIVGHAIHDGNKRKGNPFVWLFGRFSFSIVLYLHPYYQVGVAYQQEPFNRMML